MSCLSLDGAPKIHIDEMGFSNTYTQHEFGLYVHDELNTIHRRAHTHEHGRCVQRLLLLLRLLRCGEHIFIADNSFGSLFEMTRIMMVLVVVYGMRWMPGKFRSSQRRHVIEDIVQVAGEEKNNYEEGK